MSNWRLRCVAAALISAMTWPAGAQGPPLPGLLPLRERAVIQDAWLKTRLDTLVAPLMRRHGVDMWILVAREYNEDPVVRTMLPATWMSARRRTILIFTDRGAEGVERLAVSRYPVGDAFPAGWDPEREPHQWKRVAALVDARDPQRIAVNRSETFALADGLSASEERQLLVALDHRAKRVVSYDSLALGWLETRIPEEREAYGTIMRAAHSVVAEGLSEAAVTPGITTTEALVWWYRERLAQLGLDAWCQPSVNIQRAAQPAFAVAGMTRDSGQVIRGGDLVHVDFCTGYLGLKTDTQQMAYVLRPGENTAPAGLRAGLAAANRVQDALVGEFETGISGNELLAGARKRAIAAGLEPTIYSHAIGYHGHGAGPWIGAWENQAAVPGLGDYPINAATAWSIELSAAHAVPEWGGQKVRFMLEVDGYFDGRRFDYIDGRQTELHLIPRQ